MADQVIPGGPLVQETTELDLVIPGGPLVQESQAAEGGASDDVIVVWF